MRWSAAFCTPLCSPYQPKPSFRASKLTVASGACLDRRMGVWCHKYVNPLLQRPPSITQGHVQRILRGWGCLYAPDLLPPPHNGGQATLLWAKIAVSKPTILHETAKIRTTTTGEGIPHLLGSCMKGFEVVCSILHTVMLAIPAQTKPQSPRKIDSGQWGLPGQAYGCVVP